MVGDNVDDGDNENDLDEIPGQLLSVGRYCSVYFLCRFFLVLVSTTTEQDSYHHAYFIRHVIKNCRGDVFFPR